MFVISTNKPVFSCLEVIDGLYNFLNFNAVRNHINYLIDSAISNRCFIERSCTYGRRIDSLHIRLKCRYRVVVLNLISAQYAT